MCFHLGKEIISSAFVSRSREEIFDAIMKELKQKHKDTHLTWIIFLFKAES